MQDLRLAVRSLLATPVVSVVAALSLALGIGANTALYSIANALLFRPLTVREPERLVRLSDASTTGNQGFFLSVFEDIRGRTVFDGVSAWATARFTHAEGIEAEPIAGVWVSGSYLDMLGVRAQAGRSLSDADDRAGGGASGLVMVISDAFWRRRFQGDASVVGRTFTLDGVPVSIVGVTERGFLHRRRQRLRRPRADRRRTRFARRRQLDEDRGVRRADPGPAEGGSDARGCRRGAASD